MCSIVSDWLKKYARKNKYEVYDSIYGSLDLEHELILQNAGAV